MFIDKFIILYHLFFFTEGKKKKARSFLFPYSTRRRSTFYTSLNHSSNGFMLDRHGTFRYQVPSFVCTRKSHTRPKYPRIKKYQFGSSSSVEWCFLLESPEIRVRIRREEKKNTYPFSHTIHVRLWHFARLIFNENFT